MDAVLRGAVIYFGVLVLLRIAGKRTLSEATAFDFVLLLIIAEAVQQALLGDDYSITNALLVVGTLIGIDIAMSLLKRRFPRLERVIDGQPLMLIENGRLLEDHMRKARVDESDILEAARRRQGLEHIDQIKYAVLEQSGGISVIPVER